MVSRRKFLKSVLAGGLSLFLDPSLEALSQTNISASRTPSTGKMLHNTIPKSGESIPIVGLGTATAFDVGDTPEERSAPREVLKLFYANGGRFIDTSSYYGRGEQVIGDLSTQLGINHKLFMATKVLTKGREKGIKVMNNSFRKLNVRKMDLMQVHQIYDFKTHYQTILEWKKEGRIRYAGVTHDRNMGYDYLMHLIKTKDLDFVQFNYAIANREAEERLIPMAKDHGVAVIINRPFVKGSLFRTVKNVKLPEWTKEFNCSSWAQFFLKYILSTPGVTCAIPQTSKPKHLIDNMQAGLGPLPNQNQRRKMVEYFDQHRFGFLD